MLVKLSKEGAPRHNPDHKVVILHYFFFNEISV